MKVYYNEKEPFAAQTLRNLIDAGLIAPGIVDDRSIEDVQPSDLSGFTQCHFFAGIGVWSYALRKAGWPDSRQVWTGSCPCQPFSTAGKGEGFADERHLWPAWFHLISQRKPPTVLGEQVASKDGLGWFDLVHSDLEAERYAVAAADLCAAGVEAPHIRQRLFFVADADGRNASTERQQRSGKLRLLTQGCGAIELGGLAHAASPRRASHSQQRSSPHRLRPANDVGSSSLPSFLADSIRPRLEEQCKQPPRQELTPAERGGEVGDQKKKGGGLSPFSGQWLANCDLIYCRDGRWRPVEPGSFPLVDGAPARMGRLRAYGNAIVAEVATTFIQEVQAVLFGEEPL